MTTPCERPEAETAALSDEKVVLQFALEWSAILTYPDSGQEEVMFLFFDGRIRWKRGMNCVSESCGCSSRSAGPVGLMRTRTRIFRLDLRMSTMGRVTTHPPRWPPFESKRVTARNIGREAANKRPTAQKEE